jgi:hypothetical protein
LTGVVIYKTRVKALRGLRLQCATNVNWQVNFILRHWVGFVRRNGNLN